MEPADQWSFDQRTAALSGDVLWFKYRGRNGLEHAKWSVGVAGEAIARGAAYMVADVRGSEADGAYRKYVGEHAGHNEFRAVVFIGATPAQKVAQKVITLSLLLVNRHTPPMGYVDTEQQARAWVEEQRASTGQPAPPPTA